MRQAVGEKSARTGNGKSAEAFRTIGEVAVRLDIPQHVLRFWDGAIIARRTSICSGVSVSFSMSMAIP